MPPLPPEEPACLYLECLDRTSWLLGCVWESPLLLPAGHASLHISRGRTRRTAQHQVACGFGFSGNPVEWLLWEMFVLSLALKKQKTKKQKTEQLYYSIEDPSQNGQITLQEKEQRGNGDSIMAFWPKMLR